MTCVSGNIIVEVGCCCCCCRTEDEEEEEERGESLDMFFWEVEVGVVAVAVVAADGGVGVREERLRAALIRTLTVDGILLSSSSSISSSISKYYSQVIVSAPLIYYGVVMLPSSSSDEMIHTYQIFGFRDSQPAEMFQRQTGISLVMSHRCFLLSLRLYLPFFILISRMLLFSLYILVQEEAQNGPCCSICADALKCAA